VRVDVTPLVKYSIKN